LADQNISYKTSPSLVIEGIAAGRRIAKISVATLISIGAAELVTGYISESVVATADGIDSISDATISFIVFLA
jgi:divalent metal cation (Fe/Co/Zn/Cd) transporter